MTIKVASSEVIFSFTIQAYQIWCTSWEQECQIDWSRYLHWYLSKHEANKQWSKYFKFHTSEN